MAVIPSNYKYTSTHEWIRLDADGLYSVGITQYAQKVLGDLVYVELPMVGDSLVKDKECGVVESVKAASDVYAPLSGRVMEVNSEIIDTPNLINQSPYDKGWILRLDVQEGSEQWDSLLDASAYADLLKHQD